MFKIMPFYFKDFYLFFSLFFCASLDWYVIVVSHVMTIPHFRHFTDMTNYNFRRFINQFFYRCRSTLTQRHFTRLSFWYGPTQIKCLDNMSLAIPVDI